MRTSRMLWLSLTFLMMSTSIAQGGMVAVSTDLGEIRETPKINKYNLLLQAPRHYPLRVLSSKDDFLQVRDFRGQTGWVQKSLVDNSRSAVVKIKRGNLREGPGKSYPLALRAERGVCFKVVKVEGSWVHLVHSSGQKGWMHRSLLWGLN